MVLLCLQEIVVVVNLKSVNGLLKMIGWSVLYPYLNLFFNTGIPPTYGLYLTKRNPTEKGRFNLIDGSSLLKSMKKSLGSKRKYMDDTKPTISNLIKSLKNRISQRFLIMSFSDIRRLPLNNPQREW